MTGARKNQTSGLQCKPLSCYNLVMKEMIDCAMKRKPCDLVIRNAQIFNVFTGETETGEIAVKDGLIAGIGKGYDAAREYDGAGMIFLPGLIDAHIHVESSMLSPEQFACLAVPHGTTGIIADPHEIVNVCGVEGAEYMEKAFSRLRADGVNPLDVYLQLPSCVPATPFETAGATLDARVTREELARGMFFGLGEMMNYPAVIAGDEEILAKTEAARDAGKIADGHAPAVTGDALNAYLCAGIATDHESLTMEEVREKIARGMYVQIRCGSSANNIEMCKEVMTSINFRRFLLCSDDKHAHDLLERGHLDDALRRIVRSGVPAKMAIPAATLNVAECYGLKGHGAIAPGCIADMVGVKDLKDFQVGAVFKRGVLVAEAGRALFSCGEAYLSESVLSTVRVGDISARRFRLPVRGDRARAMRVMPYGLVTDEEIVPVCCEDGDVVLRGTDLCKLAVIERHFASGNIGLGLVKGYGFRGGAIGISVAHDSHNLVVLGDDNDAMSRVAEMLKEMGGGMALVGGGKEERFPLDIAGLMSSHPAQEVAACTAQISASARAMGVRECYDPFMTLAFLALPVIPHLKLTDKGLFDVDAFAFREIEP